MPKMDKKKKRELTDSDTSDSGPDDVAQNTKKAKGSASDSKAQGQSASNSNSKSQSASNSNSKSQSDSYEMIDGEATWKITDVRLVKIRNFKGKRFVDVREYYKDAKGDLKPGKKGICLSLEHWDMFRQIVPEVNERLKNHHT